MLRTCRILSTSCRILSTITAKGAPSKGGSVDFRQSYGRNFNTSREGSTRVLLVGIRDVARAYLLFLVLLCTYFTCDCEGVVIASGLLLLFLAAYFTCD